MTVKTQKTVKNLGLAHDKRRLWPTGLTLTLTVKLTLIQ